jgi:hypothetical protein
MSNPSRMTLPLIPYSLGKGRSKLPRSALHLNIPYLMRSISNEKRTGGNCTPSKRLPAAFSRNLMPQSALSLPKPSKS